MNVITNILLQIGDDRTELEKRIRQRTRLLPALNEVVYGNQSLQVPTDLALIVRQILKELRDESRRTDS